MHYNSFMIKQWQIDGGYCFLRNILCLLMVTAMGSEAWGQTAGVAVSATKLSLNEGSSSNYTVSLDRALSGHVTVTVASDNGDVTTNPTALSFTTTDWSTAQTVTVTAGEDTDSLIHTVSSFDPGTTADSVTVAVADDEASGICGRTRQVREAIIRAVSGITDCANITATHLVSLTGLNLSGHFITTLQAGDFAGLGNLTQLRRLSPALAGAGSGRHLPAHAHRARMPVAAGNTDTRDAARRRRSVEMERRQTGSAAMRVRFRSPTDDRRPGEIGIEYGVVYLIAGTRLILNETEPVVRLGTPTSRQASPQMHMDAHSEGRMAWSDGETGRAVGAAEMPTPERRDMMIYA